jgi:phospholipid N-methyltransferase
MKRAVADPKSIGAVAPSGARLGEAMWKGAEVRDGQVVVEVGAGTGGLTQVFFRPGITFIALEPDHELAVCLRRDFEGIDVVEEKATELDTILAARGHATADRILSGLPFAIWPQEVQDANLSAIVRALAPDGRFVTFTYVQSPWLAAGRRFRESLDAHFGRVERTPIVWWNVLPAFAYVCSEPKA